MSADTNDVLERIGRLESQIAGQPEDVAQGTPKIPGLLDRLEKLEATTASQSQAKRFDLSEKLINGLLAANEHLDDKAGRILGAMAFLTAAAAAIFTKAYSPSPPSEMIRRRLYDVLPATVGVDVTNAINRVSWDVPHATILGFEWSLVTFAVYMLLVFVGAVLYLTALGPFLNIPKAWKERSKREPSLLFFYFVAEQSEPDWAGQWSEEKSADLEARITSNQIYESRMIAQNARAKYTYLSVGSIFFIMAIFCLMALIAGILTADNRIAWLLTTIGGVAWSVTLAAVTKVRPPKETKLHWVYITVTGVLIAVAVFLSTRIWG
jgi:hypothetical protein